MENLLLSLDYLYFNWACTHVAYQIILLMRKSSSSNSYEKLKHPLLLPFYVLQPVRMSVYASIHLFELNVDFFVLSI